MLRFMEQYVSGCSDEDLLQELIRRRRGQAERVKQGLAALATERAAFEKEQQQIRAEMIEERTATKEDIRQMRAAFEKEQQRIRAEMIEEQKATKEDIRQMRAELETERALFREEREQIYKLVDGTGDEVVEMNVGGQVLSATRSTLVQIEGSFLSAMFSGRWDRGHKRDSAGRIFVDADPYCFAQILSLLRLRRISGPGCALTMPDISKDKANEFTMLLDYFVKGLMTTNEIDILKHISESCRVSQEKLQSDGLLTVTLSSCGGADEYEQILGPMPVGSDLAVENSFGVCPSWLRITFRRHQVQLTAVELQVSEGTDSSCDRSALWMLCSGSQEMPMRFPSGDASANERTGRLEAAATDYTDTLMWKFPKDFSIEHIILYGFVKPK